MPNSKQAKGIFVAQSPCHVKSKAPENFIWMVRAYAEHWSGAGRPGCKSCLSQKLNVY